jgi:membrane protein
MAESELHNPGPASPPPSASSRPSGHRPLGAARDRYKGSLAQRFFRELGAIEFFDQTMLFGANLLISLIPLLILISGFASQRVDDDLALRLGLDRRASAIVSNLFHSSPPTLDAGTVITLLILIAGMLAVASSLQTIYERVFRQDHRRSLYRLLIWVVMLCGVLAFESLVGRPARDAAEGVGLVEVVTFAIFVPFFWWSMHLLLQGRLGWRKLLPSALATGFCFAGLGVFSHFYFSSTIVSDSKTYGTIGAVLGVVTWLIAVGSVIIIGAVAGAVWRDRSRGQGESLIGTAATDDAR